jgi:hypothetical protein
MACRRRCLPVPIAGKFPPADFSLGLLGADFSGESPFRSGMRRVPRHLSRKETDFDLGLVEPAFISGRIVHGEPIPDFGASLIAEHVSDLWR